MNQVKLYSKNNTLQRKDAFYILDNYARLVKWKKNGQEKILDIGSGDGSITLECLMPHIPENFVKLTGFDVSMDMVNYAKKQVKDDRIDFVRVNIEDEDIPRIYYNYFNHVFSFYCLHWVQNQRLAFQNIYNLLSPGGDILLMFLSQNAVFDIYESMANSKKWIKYMPDYKKYISPYYYFKEPIKELENVLTEAGFSIHVCREEKMSFSFKSLDLLENAIKAVNPFLKYIPNEELQDYIEDYKKEIRKLTCVKVLSGNNNSEETVSFTYNLLIVFASKPIK